MGPTRYLPLQCYCSPLWRNGPPGKPVLCNACGSRWRTKGTLANYSPLHAKLLRGTDGDEKLPPFHVTTAWHVQKHFQNSLGNVQTNVGNVRTNVGRVRTNAAQYHYYRGLKRETESNKPASGSGILISESSTHSESSEENDISDPPEKDIWDLHVPSKKRTKVTHQRIMPHIESFRRELLNILHQQQQESKEFSKSLENILIERKDVSIYSETALGACHLKPPVDSNRVSKPSSHVIDNENPCFNKESLFIEGTGDANEMKRGPAKENTLATNSL
ncbi:hypothetical protein ACHQM5_006763 [Ranunculus cassubicifolius]